MIRIIGAFFSGMVTGGAILLVVVVIGHLLFD